jgi:hypothetical protein
MAVLFSVEQMPVTKVDLVMTVSYGPGKLGELRISRGGVDWWPRSAHTQKRSYRWSAFARLLESGEATPGVRVPKTAPRRNSKKTATARRRRPRATQG